MPTPLTIFIPLGRRIAAIDRCLTALLAALPYGGQILILPAAHHQKMEDVARDFAAQHEAIQFLPAPDAFALPASGLFTILAPGDLIGTDALCTALARMASNPADLLQFLGSGTVRTFVRVETLRAHDFHLPQDLAAGDAPAKWAESLRTADGVTVQAVTQGETEDLGCEWGACDLLIPEDDIPAPAPPATATAIEHMHGGRRMKGELFDHRFPYHLFRRGDRVALYGAGDIGRKFYWQAKELGYVTIVAIVDRDAAKQAQPELPVELPSALDRLRYDYVLITIHSESTARAIRRDLEQRGIPAKKIVWDGKTYHYREHFRNVTRPILEAGTPAKAAQIVRALRKNG